MQPQQRPNERQAITNLQRYLRQLSFDYPAIPSPPIDGIFESVTERSLRTYQAMKGLPDTGRADLETWTLLFDDYNASLARNTRGNGFYIFPRDPVGYELSLDEQHFLVEVVQYMLGELRVLYDDIPSNERSGVYDGTTVQGVAVFQGRHGLPVTGKVDLMTWNALTDAYRRISDRDEQ
jgi:peptidoglycan hydrolase-like protein with peptidoglycan-binding domain